MTGDFRIFGIVLTGGAIRQLWKSPPPVPTLWPMRRPKVTGCGLMCAWRCPPPMLQAMLNLLNNLGVERENIFYDDFGG
ncbi:MAG TPA: hypothetical protein ENJ86_13810 [Methylothermaceae bacterium]|nr:hypothetical protein [Methylothermaceae bacterium]